MKVMYLISILMLVSLLGVSQQSAEHFSSAVPDDSRYELLQPQGEYSSLFTIMLDKFEGKISRLVKRDSGDFVWEQMIVTKHPDDVLKDHTVNYQIFFSADGILMTLLVNVNTGATWRLIKDNTYGLLWSAIK